MPMACFNPRARTGRDGSAVVDYALVSGFNPRARTGRDALRRAVRGGAVGVSIHAPARGATLDAHHSLGAYQVSIHAPARGATRIHYYVAVESAFQSTRPHGARRSGSDYLLRVLRFNPRARTGRDT